MTNEYCLYDGRGNLIITVLYVRMFMNRIQSSGTFRGSSYPVS